MARKAPSKIADWPLAWKLNFSAQNSRTTAIIKIEDGSYIKA
jgi:hypothetical protein